LRNVVQSCLEQGVEYLTVFAFSSENWKRPPEEVGMLMQLFIKSLKKEIRRLESNEVRLRIIGDLSRFDPKLQAMVKEAEQRTAGFTKLNFTIAANYGGRWDILQAAQKLALATGGQADQWTEADLSRHLSMNFAPEPDLFIRTGGEKRISNFLLWQLAYTELYFTDALWPEFNGKSLKAAIDSFGQRERRFGRTSEQVAQDKAASGS
jgi:undecaprenyl diphosphate synthase